MNELVEKEQHELITPEDFDFIVKFDEAKKRYKIVEDKLKHAGKEFLDSKEQRSYVQEGDGVKVRIYEKQPYSKQKIDAQSLKKDYPEIYDKYLKDVWVKGSIVIQVEYEDDD